MSGRSVVAVLGASGRTGAEVVRAVIADSALELGAAVVSPGSKMAGARCQDSSLSYTSDLRAALGAVDGVIDFSVPEASIEAARICADLGKPILVATTGLSDAQRSVLAECASRIPVLLCSNTSLGIAVLTHLATEARRLLPGFDVEIVEMHHKGKKDAPSGTALSLGRALADERPASLVFDRSSSPRLREPEEIGITSLRGGDVAGEHTIFFLGPSERLELVHRAKDRSVFAHGAVTLFKHLLHCTPGMHSVTELLGLQEK